MAKSSSPSPIMEVFVRQEDGWENSHWEQLLTELIDEKGG